MNLSDKGLRLSKPELSALLSFAASDQASPFCGVHFKAMRPRDSKDRLVKARATDGNVAVDAFGHSTLSEDAEWFVSRAFLVGVAKLADASNNVVLKFSGVNLHDAVVEIAVGVEKGTFSWPGGGAASTQMSQLDATEWDQRLTIPTRARGVKSVQLNIASLKLLAKLGAAAGVESLQCYPPPQSDERMIVRAEGNDTTWIAVIDPAPATDGEEG